MPDVPGQPTHLISFDVEEYFHAEAAQLAGVDRESWPQMPRRLEPAVGRILDLLDRSGVRATFFILGWVARHEGTVVRRIAESGHEIASHGMSHHMLGRLSLAEFARELTDSRAMLEDLSGTEVLGYRAPTFSITRATGWALDVLAECGYRYDSSIFPVRHDRYGVPGAPVGPHWAQGPGGARILEIPPLTRRILGMTLPVAGGGYLRLFPVRLIGSALKCAALASRPGMVYLHPWELDPDHPDMGMRGLRRFRHRVNLSRTAAKLAWLLKRYSFGPVVEQLDSLQTAADRTGSFLYTSQEVDA